MLAPFVVLALLHAEPEPTDLCAQWPGCVRLECALNQGLPVEAPARDCLDAVKDLPLEARGDNLAAIIRMLEGHEGPGRAEARRRLQRLEREARVEIDRLVAAGQPGRAAQLARSFADLSTGRGRAEKLRAQAQAHHLARAAELSASPDAAWIHQALAAEFGGPPPPEPSGAGTWKLEVKCSQTPARLALPPGVELTLKLRCLEEGAPESPDWNAPLSTFEGSLSVRCVGWESAYAVRANESGGELLRQLALDRAVRAATLEAVGDCVGRHSVAEEKECADLPKLATDVVLARAYGHARFTHRWVKCFREWFETHEGAKVPEPPPSLMDRLNAEEVGR